MSNPTGICKCGCGGTTNRTQKNNTAKGWVKGEPHDFINGHFRKGTAALWKVTVNESGICKCGCGGKTPLAKNTIPSKGYIEGKPLDYIKGHHHRPHERTLSYPELNYSGLCLCGCGGRTKTATYNMLPVGIKKGVPLRHIRGHQSKDGKLLDRYEVKDMGYKTPCWMWTGPTDIQGYGKTGGACVVAHRKVYEVHRGKIGKGMTLHHLCENKGCVNPDHLRPLTRSEHMREHARGNRFPREVFEAVRAAAGSDATVAALTGISAASVWRIRKGLLTYIDD